MFDFFVKTELKTLLFTGIPFFYLRPLSMARIRSAFALKRDGNLRWGILLGTASFAIIITAYFIFRGMIDFNSILAGTQEKSKVTPANFIFVAFYLTFGNSSLVQSTFHGLALTALFVIGLFSIMWIVSRVFC